MQVFAIAAAGLSDASSRFAASAERTARAPLDNLAEESVERIEAETAFKANASVLKTADEMYGSLLDILA
ncbi:MULTISPECIES: flagellar basal body rod C-terminal domain-containing protein [unclassified Brevundimonas]|uniref:flagellar basal body rod C-terminal domain-containing protein n=1 Tax=unclassified Brevundimonas TaxID=2622653 RepID=UPI003B58772F